MSRLPKTSWSQREYMGNFYSNVTLKGPTQEDIAGFLRGQGREAIISPAVGDLTVVYDAGAEGEDGAPVSVAQLLSAQHQCTALAVMCYDDDILYYWLFEEGQEVDTYCSSPGYFEGRQDPPTGGDAAKLCRAFVCSEVEKTLRDILQYNKYAGGDLSDSEFLFETARHEKLCKALNIPEWAVGTGYSYLCDDEVPEGLDMDNCIILEGGKSDDAG